MGESARSDDFLDDMGAAAVVQAQDLYSSRMSQYFCNFCNFFPFLRHLPDLFNIVVKMLLNIFPGKFRQVFLPLFFGYSFDLRLGYKIF